MTLYLYQEGDYSFRNCLRALLLFHQISASLVESVMQSKFPSVCCFFSALSVEIGHDSSKTDLKYLALHFGICIRNQKCRNKGCMKKGEVSRQLLLWWDTDFYVSALTCRNFMWGRLKIIVMNNCYKLLDHEKKSQQLQIPRLTVSTCPI